MTSDDTETKQITLRLPVGLVERLNAHAQRLMAQHPGVHVSRTDAIRALLLDGLDKAEPVAESPPTRRKPSK